MTELSRVFRSAHVIVVGNEKGGSGKSTIAMHLVVALLDAGMTVGTIDLDSRQQSLTRYLENREDWARRRRLDVALPVHYAVASGTHGHLDQDEERDFGIFSEAIGRLEHTCDFVIIDSPGSDNYLSRIGHSMADTLITPINESFVDLDVLVNVDGESFGIIRPSQYAMMVRESRRRRFLVDGGGIDWIVVRNRFNRIASRNKQRINELLDVLPEELDFRLAPSLGDRVIFRELFPRGLTLFDVMNKGSGINISMSHLAARQEVRALLKFLDLPMNRKLAEPEMRAVLPTSLVS